MKIKFFLANWYSEKKKPAVFTILFYDKLKKKIISERKGKGLRERKNRIGKIDISAITFSSQLHN